MSPMWADRFGRAGLGLNVLCSGGAVAAPPSHGESTMSLGLILIILVIIYLLGGFPAGSAAMATAWAIPAWGSAG